MCKFYKEHRSVAIAWDTREDLFCICTRRSVLYLHEKIYSTSTREVSHEKIYSTSTREVSREESYTGSSHSIERIRTSVIGDSATGGVDGPPERRANLHGVDTCCDVL